MSIIFDFQSSSEVWLYLPVRTPGPPGPWGLVLEPMREDRGTVLDVIAFGLRHPPRESGRWSVYDRAHGRSYGSQGRDNY